jgi:hypothetical protein
MTRRWAGAIVAAAALVVAFALWLWLRPLRERPGGQAPEVAAPPAAVAATPASEPPLAAEAATTWTARLYFPAASDRLLAEEHAISSGESPRERASAALRALLAATPAAPRVPIFPTAVELGRALLLEDGTFVVDLRAAESADPPASGSTVEQLRVYALVHTVLRNVPEVGQVVLLWNGRQRPSFAGHLDTARPLRLRSDLEAPEPAR